jgi:hypothetical protein
MINNKTLCLVAIFKNESHILKEWIAHYINEGVEKFFLIDNGSSDNYLHCLKPYIEQNTIDLVLDKKRYCQVELYNKHFLEKCKEYKWVLVCDLDEFVYARKEFSAISQYLNTLHDEVNQVLIPWKMFGSCGYNTIEHKQPERVVESFLTRKKATDKIEIKTITRTSKLLSLHQHRCHLIEKRMNHEDFFINIDEEKLDTLYLHLNHYAIQSLEWFMRVKATRGDVCTPNLDHIRIEDYFKRYDINDIVDTELSLKYKL